MATRRKTMQSMSVDRYEKMDLENTDTYVAPPSDPDAPATISFVGYESGNTASTFTPTWATSGALAGDLAIVFMDADSTVSTATPNDFTQILFDWGLGGYLFKTPIWWKVLTAADITTPPTFPAGGSGSTHRWEVLVYRGGSTSVSLASSIICAASDTTADIGGFSKSPTHQGVVTIVVDRDAGSTLTVPSGFTARGTKAAPDLWSSRAADLLNGSYTSGDDIIWTACVGTYVQIAVALEITG